MRKPFPGSGSRRFWLPRRGGSPSPTTGSYPGHGQRAMGKRWAMRFPHFILSVPFFTLIVYRSPIWLGIPDPDKGARIMGRFPSYLSPLRNVSWGTGTSRMASGGMRYQDPGFPAKGKGSGCLHHDQYRIRGVAYFCPFVCPGSCDTPLGMFQGSGFLLSRLNGSRLSGGLSQTLEGHWAH